MWSAYVNYMIYKRVIANIGFISLPYIHTDKLKKKKENKQEKLKRYHWFMIKFYSEKNTG